MPVALRIEADFGKQSRLAGKDFTKKVIAAAEKKALREAKDLALAKYRATTRTWDGEVSWWARTIKHGYSVWNDRSYYKFVDKGTEVRYASMNKGYKAKTHVGKLYSYGGAPGNRVMYISRLVPREGIEARGFTAKIDELVGKKIRQVFVEELHTRWRV